MQEIMARIGLTDQEVRDAETKFSAFVKTLDHSQKETLKEEHTHRGKLQLKLSVRTSLPNV